MATRHFVRTAFRSIIMVGVLPYLSLARSQNLSAQLLQLIFSSSPTTTLFVHPKSSDLLLLDSSAMAQLRANDVVGFTLSTIAICLCDGSFVGDVSQRCDNWLYGSQLDLKLPKPAHETWFSMAL